VHGLDWQREKWGQFARWVLKQCEYTSINFPNRTIVVSKALREYFWESHGSAVTYIPNGTVLPHVREASKIRQMGIEPGRYVLFVGRLVPEKGCHYLLEAFRRLDTDLELVVAGGTSFSTEYVDRLHALAGGRTRFLGYVYGDVLDELYSNARLFVLPSDIEGLPIALLEAMSFGNCCLTSDIPENLEVIGDEGVTFRKGDVDDLAAKMASLLDRPERCRNLGDRARRHVLETYDWDGVTLHTEAIYYSLLRGF
jgi:glycosyltransferase involved in cell wall biosynthesis